MSASASSVSALLHREGWRPIPSESNRYPFGVRVKGGRRWSNGGVDPVLVAVNFEGPRRNRREALEIVDVLREHGYAVDGTEVLDAGGASDLYLLYVTR